MYNRDARSKVERDEAKARQEEQAAQQVAEDREREYRRQLLLQRAGRAANDGEQAAAAAAGTSGPAEAAVVEVQAPLQHINFWHEEEARAMAQHPDVLVRL